MAIIQGDVDDDDGFEWGLNQGQSCFLDQK